MVDQDGAGLNAGLLPCPDLTKGLCADFFYGVARSIIDHEGQAGELSGGLAGAVLLVLRPPALEDVAIADIATIGGVLGDAAVIGDVSDKAGLDLAHGHFEGEHQNPPALLG